MVGIVPRSAKLMELTGLFSGEAKGLIGRGVGTPAFEGTPVGQAGGMCAHHGFSASDLLSLEYGSKVIFLSRDPVLHRAPHALESKKIQQYAISGFRSPVGLYRGDYWK